MLHSGSWMPVVAAFVFFALFSILTLYAFGPTVYFQWLDALKVNKAAPLATNMSLYGFTSRFGFPGLGLVLAVLLLVGMAFLVLLKKTIPNKCE